MTTVPEVYLDADLHVEVVTPDGATVHAHLTGSGRRLHMGLDRLDVVGPELGRHDLGRAAQMLSDAGLTVDLTGPRGPVATAGAGARSRVGAILLGSERVVLARGPDARRLVWALVAPSWRRVVAVSGVVVLLGVAGRHWSRRDAPRRA